MRGKEGLRNMRIKQLRDRRAQIRASITALREKLTAEARPMTDDERKQADEDMAALEAVNSEIELEERMIEDDRRFAAATAATNRGPEPVTPHVQSPDPNVQAASTAQRHAGIISVRDRTEDDPMCGFHDVADFAMAVRAVGQPNANAHLDPRLKAMWDGRGPAPVGAEQIEMQRRADAPTTFHQESHTTEGYMVPPEVRAEVFRLIFAEGSLLDVVDPEPTSSNAVEIETDEETPWGATGVQANWRAEGSAMTASTLTTKRVTVRLDELYAFVLATEELLEDAPRLNNRLTQQAAAAIRFKASEALVTGTGAGQPLGWLNSNYSGSVSVAKESGQAADTIVAANVLKMLSRLQTDGADMSQIFWLANRDTLPQIAVMTIGDQPVWTPPNQGMARSPNGMLLGHPIIFSEHAETVGDKGDLQLCNVAGYYAAVKGGPAAGMKFATSIHLHFDYNMAAFRWIFRLAGQPYLSAAITPNKGGTKSHFVFLDARA